MRFQMPITPEDRARQNIDKLLMGAGWIVQDKRVTNLSAGRGVAGREFPLKSGYGEAFSLPPFALIYAVMNGPSSHGQTVSLVVSAVAIWRATGVAPAVLRVAWCEAAKSEGVQQVFFNFLHHSFCNDPVVTGQQ